MTDEQLAAIRARCDEFDSRAQSYDDETPFKRADVKALLAEVGRLRAAAAERELLAGLLVAKGHEYDRYLDDPGSASAREAFEEAAAIVLRATSRS